MNVAKRLENYWLTKLLKQFIVAYVMVQLMSFENERKRRMDKILDLLASNPEGLSIQTIAQSTQAIREVTKERLLLYIEELEWSGLVIRKRDGRIKLK